MGQRFQIYVRLPEIYYNENNPNNRAPVTIGFHHQWLYGATAVEMMAQFIKFYAHNQNMKYGKITQVSKGEAQDIFIAVCSCLNNKSIERLHVLDDMTTLNPHRGDNNDGFFVIDLEQPESPKYAFGSLGRTEGGEYSLSEGLYTAESYLKSYYKIEVWPEVQGRGGTDLLSSLAWVNVLPLIDQSDLKRIFPNYINVKAAA